MADTGDRRATGNRPYRQVARAQAQRRNRDALLKVAADEFYRGSWPRISLESLAGRAGVTKQTLLRYFGSKDGLLLEALSRGAAQVFKQRWSTPRDDIGGIVENLLDHYEQWGERALRIGAWQNGPAFLARLSQVARGVHYEWVDYAFGAWLERLQGDERKRIRAALIAICDVQSWWVLAHDLQLERAEVQATLTTAVGRLLAGV
jgi:AcrR family transcriptional regulator